MPLCIKLIFVGWIVSSFFAFFCIQTQRRVGHFVAWLSSQKMNLEWCPWRKWNQGPGGEYKKVFTVDTRADERPDGRVRDTASFLHDHDNIDDSARMFCVGAGSQESLCWYSFSALLWLSANAFSFTDGEDCKRVFVHRRRGPTSRWKSEGGKVNCDVMHIYRVFEWIRD